MRAVVLVGFLALSCPVATLAQGAPAPATSPAPAAPPASAAPAPKKGGDITRDEYVARAKSNAEKRFDRMDADHDGVLTLEERQAYRAGHTRHRAAKLQ